MSIKNLASVLVLSLALIPASVRAEMPAQMAGKPEDVGLSSTQLKRLEAATKKNIDDGLIPGAVMLVARRGKVAWVSVQGKRAPDTDDPMKFDSIFRIYSMTKPITSLGARLIKSTIRKQPRGRPRRGSFELTCRNEGRCGGSP